ncbi:MAG: aminotransferase class III-fold pyridoxal phosphate-dependent enzyme, partial [Candidatus Acidiferrales bacterium]
MSAAFFPRYFGKSYPRAVRGEGCYLFDAGGKKYLDAAGGAAVVTIGHGVAAIGEAMAAQARRLAFVHTSQFLTEEAERLAARLRALAPANFREGRVFFTSGGSEAVETAIKLCRQYWLERGEPRRTRIVSRWQSYHGATLGALALSGNVKRREPYAPLLPEWGHIAPCYCYRCPLGLTYPTCDVACAQELEKFIDTA